MNNQAFKVVGGNKLSGEITPQGAKNEALQIISACLLTSEEIILENVPDIIDIRKLLGLLKGLGVSVTTLGDHSYKIKAEKLDLQYYASPEYQSDARKIRGSVMLLGPLLARYKKAFIPKPGGDKIGRRRLDTHFNGFIKLGAEFRFDEEQDHYYLEGDNLKGNYILMDEISVTGTANIVMTAVMTPGKTTIYNAACEPYLQQLCKMLVRMGAKIEGIGSNLLHIEGVTKLGGTNHRILPDMIEIGSFIGLAAMCNSEIRIKNVALKELGIIPSVFQKLGIKLEFENDDIIVKAQSQYEIENFIDGSILTIYDSPWPGLTPDLLSIILVVATQAKGSVLIHQKMFESRLFFVDKLIDMGAKIILCDPHRATVIGINHEYELKAIEMSSPDIRAGVSLLIAALSAKGTSIIHNISQIDRGYQNIEARLKALGADIERVEL